MPLTQQKQVSTTTETEQSRRKTNDMYSCDPTSTRIDPAKKRCVKQESCFWRATKMKALFPNYVSIQEYNEDANKHIPDSRRRWWNCPGRMGDAHGCSWTFSCTVDCIVHYMIHTCSIEIYQFRTTNHTQTPVTTSFGARFLPRNASVSFSSYLRHGTPCSNIGKYISNSWLVVWNIFYFSIYWE